MPAKDYRDILDIVEKIEARVSGEYPDHAPMARQYINSVLKRVDVKMYHAFNGQGYYDPTWVGELGTIYGIIADWFHANPDRVDWPHHILEGLIKSCLDVPNLSIVRDKPLDL